MRSKKIFLYIIKYMLWVNANVAKESELDKHSLVN